MVILYNVLFKNYSIKLSVQYTGAYGMITIKLISGTDTFNPDI